MESDNFLRPNKYYLDLISEVDEITANRQVTIKQTLPLDSIWNKYKLNSMNTSHLGGSISAIPDADRDVKRIEAAVACEMARISRGSSGRHTTRFCPPVLLSPRER
jgi:hypothetical protein